MAYTIFDRIVRLAAATLVGSIGLCSVAHSQSRPAEPHGNDPIASTAATPRIRVQGSDAVDVFVNGKYIGKAPDVSTRLAADVALVSGDNIIALRAQRGKSASPFVLAELLGAFGRIGTGSSWKALAAPGGDLNDANGNWTSLGFNDDSWSLAQVLNAPLPSTTLHAGPAHPIWSSNGHDNTVLFRLKVYLPAHLQADRPVGFGAQVTGGAGGEVVEVSTPEQLAYQLCRSKDHAGKCNDDLPRTITFSGTIDYRNSVGTRAVSACVVKQCTAPAKSKYIDGRLGACEGKDSQTMLIDAAGVTPLLVGSNKTVQGLGRHAAIKGRGLALRGGVSNIVVRNLAITDINPEMVWGGDALTLDEVDRVWIDHNYFARIGRQMIVSGFGKASNVTVSWNEFDGVTDYSATCDNKHYWVMLNLGAADTISFVDNFVHDTAGRMPHAGGMKGATVAMQIANNYFKHISGHAADPQTQLVKLLIEGNYYDQVTTPIQIDATKPGYAFAPVAGITALGGSVNVDSQPLCDSALHRHCKNNIAAPMPLRSGFPLDTEVLSTLRLTSTALIKPFPADRVPTLVPLLAGPGHIN